jgi:hypothetical protein
LVFRWQGQHGDAFVSQYHWQHLNDSQASTILYASIDVELPLFVGRSTRLKFSIRSLSSSCIVVAGVPSLGRPACLQSSTLVACRVERPHRSVDRQYSDRKARSGCEESQFRPNIKKRTFKGHRVLLCKNGVFFNQREPHRLSFKTSSDHYPDSLSHSQKTGQDSSSVYHPGRKASTEELLAELSSFEALKLVNVSSNSTGRRQPVVVPKHAEA